MGNAARQSLLSGEGRHRLLLPGAPLPAAVQAMHQQRRPCCSIKTPCRMTYAPMSASFTCGGSTLSCTGSPVSLSSNT